MLRHTSATGDTKTSRQGYRISLDYDSEQVIRITLGDDRQNRSLPKNKNLAPGP
jgi:hypothetical protein